MKTMLLLASLIGCATTNPAPPAPPAPAPTPVTTACRAAGDIVFEIDHKKDAGDSVTSTTIVYASGAWTFADSTGAQRTGCLPDAELASLRDTLHAASWKTETDQLHCMAYAASYVDYLVDGKHVWTDRTCTPEHLDAASRKQLDLAIQAVTAATKA